MKFREIFRFEFAYQVKRPWFWLFFLVLVVLNFLMARDHAVADALYEEFFINSPFFIVNTTVFGSLIWLMMCASVAGDAAARDVFTRIYPLVYTAPIYKAEYVGGRFLAAYLLNALLLLAVQAGFLFAIYLPGVDPGLIGPFRPAAYLTAYAYIALPNAFVGTALQFLIANRSGRGMAAYVGSFILFFMGFFVASFLLFRRGLGTLLDPIGIRFIVEDIAHLWTTIEKNRRLLEMEGLVLTNRLFWMGIGLLGLAVTYIGFQFTHRTDGIWWWKRMKWPFHSVTPAEHESPPVHNTTSRRFPVPKISLQYGFNMQMHQCLAIASASFRTISTSWAGLALLIFVPLLTIPVVLDQMESNGVPLVSTTLRVINELTAPLSAELSRWVIIPALLIFFAGELVWREREARLGEITDAMPGSEWAPFFGKFLAIGLLLVAFTTLQMLAGMVAQFIMGYDQFQIALYLKILFGLQLFEYLLFALLVLVIHVVVNQKYAGHMVATIAYVFIALSSLFGVEHDLLVYGAGPGWSYTEMRGFGVSLGPWSWFKLYWSAWALLLAVAARLLWVRGKDGAFRFRVQVARRRFQGVTAWFTVATVVVILLTGGYIFYNTNVLNKYRTTSERKQRQAAYEQRYAQYDNIPQPEATKVRLHIEIFPMRRESAIKGYYSLVNRNAVKVDAIHIATIPGISTEIAFDRKAMLLLADEDHGHRIYTLERPLLPGDSLRLDFNVTIKPLGFTERALDPPVSLHATFFMNKHFFPTIGYQRGRELITVTDRREYGLEPRPIIAFLNDEEAYKDRGRGIAFEAVIGTDADQVAVAPGMLRQTWTGVKGGEERRYYHYSTGMIGGEWSFFSAKYVVHETSWHMPGDSGAGVPIRIYHHPQHTAHLDRMLRSIRASLDYYTRHFGPYRHEYLSVVEQPGNGTGMHADPGMITHGEGFTYWNPVDDGRSHDHPYAIVAHEMAHQWTVPFAAVEGAPVMSESLAWYYGMKVVEHARGKEALRRLFDYMWQPYPYSPIFRGEPLLRGLDPYMSYRKGPFALYTLSEYVGEESINSALRRLLEKHRSVNAPLATTLDLYRELISVTPDSLKYLLHDLFKVNTYWKFKTLQASASQVKAGLWQVNIEVETRKIVIDRAGVKTEVPMDEWILIAVFTPEKTAGHSEPLYLRKHRIVSGRQTINLMVRSRPARAGIDPYHVLNWEERSADNMKPVVIE